MQNIALSICSRCHASLWPQAGIASLARRLHTPARQVTSSQEFPPVNRGHQRRPPAPSHLRPRQHVGSESVEATAIKLDDIPDALSRYVKSWSADQRIRDRFSKFGIPQRDCGTLLKEFLLAFKQGKAFKHEDYSPHMLDHFVQALSKPPDVRGIDGVLCRVFYRWVAKSRGDLLKNRIASETTLDQMESLTRVSDYRYPTEWFPMARSMRRKVIMHVGPTNSGKTHNALRALAAARSGCYAGPLRLLAHEIADRLNNGQIIPLGAELKSDVEVDVNTNLDVGAAPVVTSSGDGRYSRPCNLITGELRIMVEPSTGLMSSTIEMMNFTRYYDVAVIDEIQMIADPGRGSSWSYAVLGVRAKELHLCGEESAVPIIEAMLKDIGDELIVNRYERLTPLVVADKSLQGDLSTIQPGDCIVAFSRSAILDLKDKVEQMTGLRAAVVYGRLPPEVRNTQAALFNDPNSGYDVLVGSDAIGMGLNLKIKRMVFHSMHKFNGIKELPLSISQTKQIAGRAGRYGLHGDSNSGGVVTTLLEADLPLLRETMAKAAPSLPRAFIRSNEDIQGKLYDQLPSGTSLKTLFEAERCLAKISKPYELETVDTLAIGYELMDTMGKVLPLADRLGLVQMPLPQRDPRVAHFARNLAAAMRATGTARLQDLVQDTDMFSSLVEVLDHSESEKPILFADEHLQCLESLDKALSAYAWLSYRNNVVFPDQEVNAILKEKTEKAIEICLVSLSKLEEDSQAKAFSIKRGTKLAKKVKRGAAAKRGGAAKRGSARSGKVKV